MIDCPEIIKIDLHVTIRSMTPQTTQALLKEIDEEIHRVVARGWTTPSPSDYLNLMKRVHAALSVQSSPPEYDE